MADLVNQPTATPTRKVQAAVLGGGVAMAIVIVAKWALHQAAPNLEFPDEVQQAFVVLITAGSAYFTRERAA